MQNFFSKAADNKLIVFIHGIIGDLNTWNNETTSFFFPQELHNELHGHSVYIFTYDSNLFAQSAEFYLIIKKLSDEIRNIDNNNNYAEIIFVAHSMGGLIAKAFLMENTKNISNKVNKLILLATPHNGNFFPTILSHISNNAQFNHLKPIEDNIFLQQLTDMWIKLYGFNGNENNAIQCYCGYEKLRTYLKLLVPLTTVSSPCCSLLHGFNKNHISIAKPENKEDEIYIWVKERIATELSTIEKLSKIALSKLYIEKINQLENRIAELEEQLIRDFKSGNDNSLINQYANILNEHQRINDSYKKLEKITNNLVISDDKTIKFFNLINNGELEEALTIFSENEIDLEIIQLDYQKDELIQKIRIMIELYNIKDDFEKVTIYYNKLMHIERNENDLLNYANINKYISNYKIAEQLYKEIIKITYNDTLKAVCLNNLGTMSLNLHISFVDSLEYLQEAYTSYKNLYKKYKSHVYLISYIETRMNYLLFEVKSTHNYEDVLKELYTLLKDNETIDNSLEKFNKLKFNLLNNIFAIHIEYERINDENTEYLYKMIADLESIVLSFMENQLYIQREYAELIAKFYNNCGSFYGYIYKSNINEMSILNLSINNFEKSLNFRKFLIPKIQSNLQEIILLEKSIGIVYADSGQYVKAKTIFNQTLYDINNLIKHYPENRSMYLEEKVEIIISYISVERENQEKNLEMFNDGIGCLDILDKINKNTYAMMYCRLILMILPSISDKNYQRELYDFAQQKLINDTSELANRMRANLNMFKKELEF